MGKPKFNAQQLADISASVEAFCEHYWQDATADVAAYRSGLTWYEDAHRFSVRASEEYGVSVDTVIDLLAVLSPRNRWLNNVKDTILVLQGTEYGEGSGYGALPENVEKAYDILAGDRTRLRGQKVTSFRHNIAYFDSSDVATTDYIMGDLFAIVGRDLECKGVYDAVSDGVVSFARKVGLLPNQVQAILWEARQNGSI